MAQKQSFRELRVWQLGCEVAVDVYRLTERFPKAEMYGLTQQMRRAATSIPANIAEGCARKGVGEFTQFLHIAAGSLAEPDTFLEITRHLDYAEAEAHTHLCAKSAELGRMLYGLIQRVRAGSRTT